MSSIVRKQMRRKNSYRNRLRGQTIKERNRRAKVAGNLAASKEIKQPQPTKELLQLYNQIRVKNGVTFFQESSK